MGQLFFNIDSSLHPLEESEVTAAIIDARVKSLSYKNLDEVKNFLPFVIDCCTSNPNYWQKLVDACDGRYFARRERVHVLVFDQSADCGCIRTYRPGNGCSFEVQEALQASTKQLAEERKIYDLLDSQAARHIYGRWLSQTQRATELPTEFVNGRLQNTSVDKSFIYTKGDGCVVCGESAKCYAASTVGDQTRALLVQLPVCELHLQEAKRHPSTFAFLASLFGLNWDLGEVTKYSYIPDELIPGVHSLVAEELKGRVGQAKKTERGWELWTELASGWRWLLRVGSFTDFAYMLFQPGVKKARYRSDSAPDHPELKFFPVHEHTAPDRKSDTVRPSFLYGHPIFDLTKFRAVGEELGAYGQARA